MQIKIHTRHTQINEDIRAYVQNKLLTISEKSMPVIDANISVDKVKHEYVVEVNLVGKHINYHGTDTHEDLHTALDASVGKIQRQLRRAKEKVKEHSATHLGYIEAQPADKTDKILDDELLEPEMVEIGTMSMEKAAKAMIDSSREFYLFFEPSSQTLNILCKHGNGQICMVPVTEAILREEVAEADMTVYNVAKAADGSVKAEKTGTDKVNVPHMTIDKAVSVYHNNAARPFFFYVNSYSGRPNILYYKDNHKISLIVPNINLYKKSAVS